MQGFCPVRLSDFCSQLCTHRSTEFRNRLLDISLVWRTVFQEYETDLINWWFLWQQIWLDLNRLKKKMCGIFYFYFLKNPYKVPFIENTKIDKLIMMQLKNLSAGASLMIPLMRLGENAPKAEINGLRSKKCNFWMWITSYFLRTKFPLLAYDILTKNLFVASWNQGCEAHLVLRHKTCGREVTLCTRECTSGKV